MTPTMELRFVERQIGKEKTYVIRILQQKWVRYAEEQTTFATIGQITEEWRDVPVVKEQV